MSNHVSIGQLARATGLAVDTVRAWERRYGRPQPVRLPSGHRRYPETEVAWLRQAAQAVARGHRPSEIMDLDEAALAALIAPAHAVDESALQAHVAAISAYDAPLLRQRLADISARNDARTVVNEHIAPLVQAVGDAWADGRLKIRHEHFLTQILSEFLPTLVDDRTLPSDAARVLLATLPGEPHGLGLHMTAVFLRALNRRPVVLGTQVPIDEIARAVDETDAGAVAISVSCYSGGTDADRCIRELRETLDSSVRIMVGGRGARGARRAIPGVDYVEDFADLEARFPAQD